MKFKTREEADIWMMLAGAAIIGQRHEDAASIADRTMEQWRERRTEIDAEREQERRRFQERVPQSENTAKQPEAPGNETT